MFDKSILLIVLGYLAVMFKNVPVSIFHMCKAHICCSISSSSLKRDMFIRLNNYILSLDNKAINNHLEYRTEWIGQEFKIVPSIGYGEYFIKIDTLTYAKISKIRIEKSGSFEVDDRITIVIMGLKRKEIFKQISTTMSTINYDNKIKYYSSRDRDYSLISKKSFDNIFNKEKETIIKFIENWKSQKEIYDAHEIIYKTGILLYGEPGTGKSTFCKAIASYLDYNIHAIDIHSFINKPEELKDRIASVTENSVILFEDIDCIISDRTDENISEKSKFMIGTVLNILDGVNSPNNVIFLATTNHIDKIDSAILRNGRFDLVAEISKIDRETAKEMVNSFNSSLDLDKYTYPINPSFLQNEILNNQLKLETVK